MIFFSFLNIARQAIKCRLKSVAPTNYTENEHPNSLPDSHTKWPSPAIKSFVRMTGFEKTLQGYVDSDLASTSVK